MYICLLEDLITDANTEEESTISITEKEEFPTGLFFLLENISLFAVRFMVYGAHRNWQTLSHNVVLSTPRHETGFERTTLLVFAVR